MKNKFKLLSITPLVATTVAPVCILASCGSNHMETINMVDTMNFDDSKITPLELKQDERWVNQQEATNRYIDEVNNNPDIFEQDMLYGAAQRTQILKNEIYPEYGGFALSECQFGFSKPTFGWTTAWEMGFEDTKYHTVSFKEKILIKYISTFSTDQLPTTRTIKIDVEFNNVIFMASEAKKEDAGTEENPRHVWNVCLMDETFGEEAFWMYQYNSQPWSIEYSASDEVAQPVSGSSDNPTVYIHKCSYFSGNINKTFRLSYMYNYARQLEQECKSGLGDINKKLKWHLIDTILCIDQKSKLLSHLWNAPDVCLTHQLRQENVTPEDGEKHLLEGIYLIRPKKKGYSIPEIKLLEPKITAEMVGNPNNTLTIANEAILMKGSAPNTYTIPYTLNGEFTPNSWVSFNINKTMLEVDITWQNNNTNETGVIHTFLSLHYSTIRLSIAEE